MYMYLSTCVHALHISRSTTYIIVILDAIDHTEHVHVHNYNILYSTGNIL